MLAARRVHLRPGETGVALGLAGRYLGAPELAVHQAQKRGVGCGSQVWGGSVVRASLGREQHLAGCCTDPLLEQILQKPGLTRFAQLFLVRRTPVSTSYRAR